MADPPDTTNKKKAEPTKTKVEETVISPKKPEEQEKIQTGTKAKLDELAVEEATPLQSNPKKSTDQAEDIAGDLTNTAQAAQSETEVNESKERAVGEEYERLILDAKIKENIEKDRSKLGTSSVKEVRFNHRFLVPKNGEEKAPERIKNLKEETARRIAAYTTETKDGWNSLNYSSVGGSAHLHGIGLGDILLDPDIKELLVEKNGEIIKGTRGVTASGRQAFLDEEGHYIATFDGDKFKIVSHEKMKEKSYIRAIDQEVTVRNKDLKNHEEYQSINQDIDDGTDDSFPYVKLAEEKSVVKQIKKGLAPSQRKNAEIIEEVFKEAGIHPAIIAGAIVNAYKESGLNATIQSGCRSATGVREDSWGLFQINVRARTKNPQAAAELRERMKNPRENCKEILKEVISSRRGSSLRAAAQRGASVATIAAIFARDIERPGNIAGAMKSRAKETVKFFGTSERPAPIEVAQVNEGVDIAPPKTPGKIIDIKTGQETWILGSSTVRGMEHFRDAKTGLYGISGASGHRMRGGKLKPVFLDRFKREVWSQTALRPKRVIIAGLAVNGLTQSKNPAKIAKSVKENLEAYDAMVKFFKVQGIKVQIVTCQPFQPKINAISAFNKALKTKYPEQIIDIAAKITTADDKWAKGYAAADNLHLNKQGKRTLQGMIEGSANA